MTPIKVKTNPRWEKAQFERQFVVHRDAKGHGMVIDTASGMWKEIGYPLRYEHEQDIHSNRPVPPLLATYEDGHTEETW